jgi:hypothetical protein
MNLGHTQRSTGGEGHCLEGQADAPPSFCTIGNSPKPQRGCSRSPAETRQKLVSPGPGVRSSATINLNSLIRVRNVPQKQLGFSS